MKCYNCGRADFVKEDGIYDYRASGLPYPVVLVGVPLEKCPSCGEEVVTIPDPEGLHSRLGLLIVESNRPLLHQEIRFLRIRRPDSKGGRCARGAGQFQLSLRALSCPPVLRQARAVGGVSQLRNDARLGR